MRYLVFCIVAICIGYGCVAAEARIFGRRRVNTYQRSYASPSVGHTQSDQAVAQAKANAMAAQCRLSHGAGGYRMAGTFEGVGCGVSPSCGTCTPRYRMTLVADASAKGRNGMWYRCRGWR